MQLDIAIVGSGIAGLGAAYLLNRRHRIEVFEQADYPGGHAHTVDAEAADGPQPVDTGFIVYNEVNYPHFTRLLAELQVASIPSNMSFGAHCPETGFAYSSRGLRGLFATPRNAGSPAFHRMLRDILRFNKMARHALDHGEEGDDTLDEFLRHHGFSDYFVRYYISPMSAAIWSAPAGRTLAFPAMTFFRFFKNHGLLSVRPDIPWRTVRGGSREYVRAMTRTFSDRIHLHTPVRQIRRTDSQVRLSFDDGPDRLFDRVVLAVHADQALRLLQDPSDDERRLLAHFPYQPNRVVLHDDATVLPRRRAAWASWNVRIPPADAGEQPLTMSYHMNRLQAIPGPTPYLVTLNPDVAWRRTMDGRPGHHVFFETDYDHPLYGTGSFRVQPEFATLNGRRQTCFCGAYTGYGFHEDGLASGLQAARALGVEWTS